MEFLAQLLIAAVKYVILMGIAICGALLGITLRKGKNAKLQAKQKRM